MRMRSIAIVYLIALGACGFQHGELTPPDAFEVVPSVQFEMTESTVDEASGTVQIGLLLSQASEQIVAVSYDVTGGNAMRPDDYSLADGTVTFLPGQTRRTIDLTVVADTLEEADESVILTLSGPAHATLGSATHHTVTISSDILPRISFATAATTSSNEATDEQIQAVLTVAPKADVTVQLSVAGTASPGGVDHALTDGQTLTFPAGITTKVVPLGVVQDLLDEDDETVDLGFKNPSAKLLLASSGTTHTHTITDDDPMPTVSYAFASSTTPESASATLTVSLSAVSGRTVTVGYSITGGTANVADATVVGAPGMLTFMPGQQSRTITVTVNNDALDEADETVIVSLASPTNATLGATTSHTLTIADDDNPPTVAFTAATASTNEGNAGTTVVNLAVSLSTPSGLDVTVPFSVDALSSTASDPADYTIATSPITIPAGMTTANIAVTVKGDVLDEANETVVVTLGTPTNATVGAIGTETLTINDDDATPTVAFTTSSSSLSEASTNVTLTVQLSAVSGRNVTVPYTIDAASTASNPSDYTISPASQVSILAGQTTATITIGVVEDTADEPDETVIVDLDTPTNATLGTPAAYTLTILNDDAPPTVSWNPSEANGADPEGSSPPTAPTRQVTYTLVLSAATTQTVTVPILYTGTATIGDDYTAPASVSFPPNATSANVTLTISKDKNLELDESIIMTIDSLNVTNATATSPLVRSHTLQNDD